MNNINTKTKLIVSSVFFMVVTLMILMALPYFIDDLKMDAYMHPCALNTFLIIIATAIVYEAITLTRAARSRKNKLRQNIPIFVPVAEQKELFEKEARTDVLRGYENRYKLDCDIKEKKNFFLALFDIDNFGQIDDLYGHSFADDVIQAVADKIHAFISRDKNLSFYRLDSGEFAVAATEYERDFFIYKCKDILTILKNSFRLEGKETVLSCSCGISFESQSSDDLLNGAEAALKEAKQNSIGFAVYNKKSPFGK